MIHALAVTISTNCIGCSSRWKYGSTSVRCDTRLYIHNEFIAAIVLPRSVCNVALIFVHARLGNTTKSRRDTCRSLNLI